MRLLLGPERSTARSAVDDLGKIATLRKFEIRNSKHETNSKFEFSNVQNGMISRVTGFGHLDLGNLNIVSDFDIRISDLPPYAIPSDLAMSEIRASSPHPLRFPCALQFAEPCGIPSVDSAGEPLPAPQSYP